jgi:hypothetical protein
MHQLRRLVFASIAAGLLSSGTAHATENGLNIYPVGVNTVLDGLAPDPGQTRFYNYTQYYEASKFAGANGNSSVPGFRNSACKASTYSRSATTRWRGKAIKTVSGGVRSRLARKSGMNLRLDAA